MHPTYTQLHHCADEEILSGLECVIIVMMNTMIHKLLQPACNIDNNDYYLKQ